MAGQLKDKDINLLPMLQKGEGLLQRVKNLHTALIAAGIAALLLLLVFVVCITEYAVLNGRMQELTAFLTQESNEVAVISADREKMQQMRLRCDALSDIAAFIEARKGPSEEVYAKLYSIAEGKLQISRMRYIGQEGTLTLEVTAYKASDLPLFISEMRKTGMFADLRYEGYLSKSAAGGYTATVTLWLNGGDGIA